MFYCAGCTNKAAAGDVSRSGSKRVGLLTTETRAGQTQMSSIFPFLNLKDSFFLAFFTAAK